MTEGRLMRKKQKPGAKKRRHIIVNGIDLGPIVKEYEPPSLLEQKIQIQELFLKYDPRSEMKEKARNMLRELKGKKK